MVKTAKNNQKMNVGIVARCIAVLASLFFFLGIAAAATPAATQIQNPEVMLQNILANLQNKMTQEHVSLSTSPDKLYVLVKTIILPHLDVNRMAGMTLGPKWRSASASQRNLFVDAFGLLLTRTYANAILKVTDYDMKLRPMRSDAWKTAQSVSVNGEVINKSTGQSSPVTYYMVRSNNQWLIYDFAVEGVSIVRNFRSQFEQYANLSALLEKLDELNHHAK